MYFTIQAQIYVSPEVQKNGNGSIENPFSRLVDAIQIAKPGDTVFLRSGNYRETVDIKISGIKDKPIRIEAYQNEKVIFDGTDLLKLNWKLFKNGIYVADCDVLVEQLFDGMDMLTRHAGQMRHLIAVGNALLGPHLLKAVRKIKWFVRI